MCAAMPGSRLERQLGVRATAQIDGRARERVVHRHDGVAVARDPAPVAERRVERLAERERRVLGGVVVARLEIAAPSSTRSKPGMERELLEEVVVEAGAGRDAHARRAVEREPDGESASRPSRARVRARRAPAGATGDGASSTRASASTSRSSSSRSSTETRIASGYARTTMP